MNEDPIAAHLTELITDAPAPNHEEDNYDAGYVAALANLRDSAAFKLVLEQHTNGRITELEAEVERQKALVKWFDGLASSAEKAIDRVHELKVNLFRRGGFIITKWEAARLVRAALEGEQQ